MLKKFKDNKKKGFTLVELIVVLVILAILAALLIPALTGYIDKAKEKDLTAETRQTVMAAQTLADEAYANVDVKAGVTISNDTTANSTDNATVTFKDIADLAEVEVGNIETVEQSEGKITKVVYNKSGKTCTYENGAYTVK